jgi:hypothetical protein
MKGKESKCAHFPIDKRFIFHVMGYRNGVSTTRMHACKGTEGGRKKGKM